MRIAVIVVLFVFLTSCSNENSPTYSVEELIRDEGLLSRTLNACRNDPGDQQKTSNCVNAEAADGKLRLKKMREALRN